MIAGQEHMYNRHAWPEIDKVIGEERVVILPTGSTEQHGHHLPLDVDLFLTERVCDGAGMLAPNQILVMPAIPYGLNLHHIDFPGTIHIEPDHFINYCLDVTKSLAYHGFRKILIVNGHGSNAPMIDLIARKTVLETNSVCMAVGYFSLIERELKEIIESPVVAHACEAETSLYLHLAPERVQMDKATKGVSPGNDYFLSDSTKVVRFNDWWGRWAETGVHGDATLATAEKGKRLFDAAAAHLVELVGLIRTWKIEERVDHHTHPVQRHIRW